MVQYFQIPIHVVTLYLYPSAVPGSDKYEHNRALVRAAVILVAQVNGPALWCFVADLLSSQVNGGGSLCGLVLDITKCFNILDRNLVAQVMIKAGCPSFLVQAWLSAWVG